jgi:hypothetical protein
MSRAVVVDDVGDHRTGTRCRDVVDDPGHRPGTHKRARVNPGRFCSGRPDRCLGDGLQHPSRHEARRP